MKSIYKIIIILIVILTCGIIFNSFLAKDTAEKSGYITDKQALDDEDDERYSPRSSVEMINGRLAVAIPDSVQKQAHIELVRLPQAEHRYESHATGQVIDILPLVRLRSDLRQVQTEIKMAETAVQVSGQEYERVKLLHQEAANISERDLQQSKLQWLSDGLELQGKRNKFDDLRDESIQQWGSELTGQIINNSDIVEQIIKRQLLLLLVTIENNQSLPDSTETVTITQHESPGFTNEAYFLARAVHIDNNTLGQTYLFYTPAISLRTGQYVDVWITTGNKLLQGVYIPPAAIIWYVDKPWVYQKVDEHGFIRREVKDAIITRQGWFVSDGFQNGDEIVLHGAQMLLSEEFRWSIPDEDDNP